MYLELAWFPAAWDAEHLTEQQTAGEIVGHEVCKKKTKPAVGFLVLLSVG